MAWYYPISQRPVVNLTLLRMSKKPNAGSVPALYESSGIKGYEFFFVVLVSLAANLASSETLESTTRWWFLLEAALVFAGWHTFQIYRKLDSMWQAAMRNEDAIKAYRDELEADDLAELRCRLCFLVIFLVEAGACIAVRLLWTYFGGGL